MEGSGEEVEASGEEVLCAVQVRVPLHTSSRVNKAVQWLILERRRCEDRRMILDSRHTDIIC